jgi:cysteinyl-tRNA synthetase
LESAIRGLSGRSEVNIKNFVDSAVERPLLNSGNVKPHAKSLASIIALAEWAHRYVVVNLPSQGPFFEELQRLRRLLEPSSNEEEFQIQREVNNRLALFASKNFAEADRIRDELAAQGIQLMDYKDPDTGERKTRWEVKR